MGVWNSKEFGEISSSVIHGNLMTMSNGPNLINVADGECMTTSSNGRADITRVSGQNAVTTVMGSCVITRIRGPHVITSCKIKDRDTLRITGQCVTIKVKDNSLCPIDLRASKSLWQKYLGNAFANDNQDHGKSGGCMPKGICSIAGENIETCGNTTKVHGASACTTLEKGEVIIMARGPNSITRVFGPNALTCVKGQDISVVVGGSYDSD